MCLKSISRSCKNQHPSNKEQQLQVQQLETLISVNLLNKTIMIRNISLEQQTKSRVNSKEPHLNVWEQIVKVLLEYK